jgi:hypothetical protein
VDPYSIWNDSDQQLDAMFTAQKAAGIDTVVLQWTGAFDQGSVRTIYASSSATGFAAASDDLLPRFLSAAHRGRVSVVLGLVLKSDLLDDPQTRGDAALLDQIAREDSTLAEDLLLKYRGQFDGWYIPTEPGYETVSDSAVTEIQTSYLKAIASSLHALADLPVMVSPSVPRAVEGNLSGVDFVNALAPIIRDSGIDIWNLQDGFMMTAWNSAENRALVERGQAIARSAGASIWVTLYVPGPADVENGSDPVDPVMLRNDLAAVTATGAEAAMWTFNSAMNPDPSLPNAGQRATLYESYRAGGATVWSTGASYTETAKPSGSFDDTAGRELTNGRHGTDNLTDPQWQGHQDQPNQTYQIDLGAQRPVKTVELSTLEAKDAGLRHPRGVDVETSADGRNWYAFGTATLSTTGHVGAWRADSATNARYVRLHLDAQSTGWVFLDEMTVSG